ncbi:hypothetical protein BU204_37015 [Actinophytocola xanthii]|uniref:GPP34 family phosphoprotein n=1 Tax=Actinophytocola xanthii TaxID=1912961 RepID=A0A1Q8BTZ5_9PSEU|nr:hypothetical protein BU204_37015 [Actinophytocola xanthii]
MLLADGFFLLAHDSISWRCRLSPRGLRLGLAAALLGEQLLFQQITLGNGHLRALPAWALPDPLAQSVGDQLRAEPEVTSVRDWMEFLSRDAYDAVGERLIRQNLAQARVVRRFLRTATTYVPVNHLHAAALEDRLAVEIGAGPAFREPDMVLLAGLAHATGLTRFILADTPPPIRAQRVDRAVAALPPSLQHLVGHTNAAVGDAVLTPRP